MNGFVTRLGHTVGRLFQTLFPPMPEFQGRQVVTLHNQRDFLFFRRHRYAFRSVEKVQLQEIGPRFTLKLRSLKKGLPAVKNLGELSKPLEFDTFDNEAEQSAKPEQSAETQGEDAMDEDEQPGPSEPEPKKAVPPKDDEYQWIWKVCRVCIHAISCLTPMRFSRSSRLRGERSSCNRCTLYALYIFLHSSIYLFVPRLLDLEENLLPVLALRQRLHDLVDSLRRL